MDQSSWTPPPQCEDGPKPVAPSKNSGHATKSRCFWYIILTLLLVRCIESLWRKNNCSSWWFFTNPFDKYFRQNGIHFPKVGVNLKNICKKPQTTTQLLALSSSSKSSSPVPRGISFTACQPRLGLHLKKHTAWHLYEKLPLPET